MCGRVRTAIPKWRYCAQIAKNEEYSPPPPPQLTRVSRPWTVNVFIHHKTGNIIFVTKLQAGTQVCLQLAVSQSLCTCWPFPRVCARAGHFPESVHVLAVSQSLCTCWPFPRVCARAGRFPESVHVLAVSQSLCTCWPFPRVCARAALRSGGPYGEVPRWLSDAPPLDRRYMGGGTPVAGVRWHTCIAGMMAHLYQGSDGTPVSGVR